MAEIYYKLIRADRRSIDQVPVNLQREVRAMLHADSRPLA
ncbi:CD1375 family protein [Brevibacillus laterosporus]